MDDREPKYFTIFKIELYEKLDGHAEQIAYVTEEITGIKGEITGVKNKISGIETEITGMKGEITGMKGEITSIKGELVKINEKLDSHEEQIVHVSELGNQILKELNRKSDSVYVENIDFRTKKLEKVVFA